MKTKKTWGVALAAALAAGAAWAEPVKVSERFGFDPVDATKYIQAALDSGLPEIVVDRQAGPWITTPLFVRSNQKIVLEKGVVLLAKRGEYIGRNDHLLTITNVHHVTIVGNGATFRMWREDYARGKDGKGRDYRRGEWRHTIGLFGSSDIEISDLTLEESGGDGIEIGDLTPDKRARNITLRRLVCDHNHRQGISVLSVENLLVEDCIFRNTKGTSPEDGVDIEPCFACDQIVNCVFRNCLSENNAGNGFQVALMASRASTRPCSVLFENCRASNVRYGFKARTKLPPGETDWPRGTITMRNCTLANTQLAAVDIFQNPVEALDIRFENCTIDAPAPKDPSEPVIQLETPNIYDATPAMPRFTGLTLKNVGKNPLVGESVFGRDNIAKATAKALPKPEEVVVVDRQPGKLIGASPIGMCRDVRLLVYAERPRAIAFRCGQTLADWGNRAPAKADVTVRDAAGKEIAKMPLPGFDLGTLTFSVPKAGFYTVEANAKNHAFIFGGSDAPTAVDVSLRGQKRAPMFYRHLKGRAALYVPVAPGQEGGLHLSGNMYDEKVCVRVKDAKGREVFAEPNVRRWVRVALEGADKVGMYEAVFSRAPTGYFCSYNIAVTELAPYMFTTPDRYWYVKGTK